ncbi:MAG: hypothetical protein EpisKO_41780 [Epibacterium sp.]
MNGFAAMMGDAPRAQAQGQPPQMQDPPKPGQTGDAASHGKQASPEMQKVYNRFVGACMLVVWDEKFMPKALELFQKNPNQTDALASVTAGVVQRVFQEAKKKGTSIPLEVLVHGGLEVVQQVAEMATTGGVQGIERDEIETAFYLAADKLREVLVSSGDLDLSEAEQGLQQLRAAGGDDAFTNVQTRMQGAQQKTMDAIMAKKGGGTPQ